MPIANSKLFIGVLSGCGLALLVLLLVVGGPQEIVAIADDSTHTTTLAIQSFVFDDTYGAENGVIATLTSTSSTDQKGRVEVVVTEGGVTYPAAFAETERPASGNLFVRYAFPRTEITSGSTVQATFRCYDSGGLQTFSYTRNLTIP